MTMTETQIKEAVLNQRRGPTWTTQQRPPKYSILHDLRYLARMAAVMIPTTEWRQAASWPLLQNMLATLNADRYREVLSDEELERAICIGVQQINDLREGKLTRVNFD